MGTQELLLRRQAPERLESWLASVRHAWMWYENVMRVMTTRRYLAEMDDRMLSDIGVTRADADTELARAPWDTASRPRR